MIDGVPVLEEMEQALEQLRGEITACQERIRILEPAVAGLRALQRARPARIPKALRNQELDPAGDRRKDGKAEPDWTGGQLMWNNGAKVAAIAERLNVTPASVYAHAAKYWPKRPK